MDRNSEVDTRGSEKVKSLSARRAWIEIIMQTVIVIGCVSLSARRAWIEIAETTLQTYAIGKSLSARRAWIEMLIVTVALDGKLVALRKESVDRNKICRQRF